MAENTKEISRVYGADEVVKMSPIRSMLDAGIVVSMEGLGNTGTDALGVEKTPLWFIETFVRRADIETGRVWNESEQVTREQALRMSTIWADNPQASAGGGDRILHLAQRYGDIGVGVECERDQRGGVPRGNG